MTFMHKPNHKEQKSGDLTSPSPLSAWVKKRTGERVRNGEEESQMQTLSMLMPLSWTAVTRILKMQLPLSMTITFNNFKILITVVYGSCICQLVILYDPIALFWVLV